MAEETQPQISKESMESLSAVEQFIGSDNANQAVQDINAAHQGEPPKETKKETPTNTDENTDHLGYLPEGASNDEIIANNQLRAEANLPLQDVVDPKDEVSEKHTPEVKDGEMPKNPAYNKEGETDGVKNELIIEDDLIGKHVVGGKPIEINMENPKEIVDYVTKALGIESLDQLQSTTSLWRTDAQGKAEAQRGQKEAESLFTSLPSQLQNAIMDYNRGNDWMGNLNSMARLDYSKKSSNYTDKELINAFYPDKVSKEDWDDIKSEDASDHLKSMIQNLAESANEKFTNNKSAIDSTRAGYLKEAEAGQKAYVDSIPSSEQFFNQTFPDAAPSVLEDAKKSFGDGGVNQLFFNEDGGLQEDALVKFVMAKSGKSLLDKYASALEKYAVNKHVEKQLAEKKESIRTSGGAGSGGSMSDGKEKKAVAEKMVAIFGGSNKSTFNY